ncbi:hypothetical protein [Jatrophihabitans sp.]|uniref:hypothetical protein n=1 Tax=Jatrophihabitans sp. TaxID=1932789 RepID=UPI0030C6753E|nr:hypothetical protein [Jatrophihabitans sp.]
MNLLNKLLGLVKAKPITVPTAVESATYAVVTALATHGVIPIGHVNSVTQTVAPIAALALPAVFNAVKHALATPVAKVEDILARDGVMSDAEWGRFEALIREVTGNEITHIEAQYADVELPDGMSAGHPAEAAPAPATAAPTVSDAPAAAPSSTV